MCTVVTGGYSNQRDSSATWGWCLFQAHVYTDNAAEIGEYCSSVVRKETGQGEGKREREEGKNCVCMYSLCVCECMCVFVCVHDRPCMHVCVLATKTIMCEEGDGVCLPLGLNSY